MISRLSGGELASASSTLTWCRVRHWWAMIGDPLETWVGSLSQTGFTGNFTVVPTDGWVTGFSPKLVVDLGYSRSTPFVQGYSESAQD
ncbi:hypothetical protein Hanom_Chr13g01233991 [Helianthus anomalus]